MIGFKLMAFTLYGVSMLSLWIALEAMVVERSAIHQILTAIYFLSCIVALGAGCLLHAVASLVRVPARQ